ncbi:uncharacterized protein B0H18DRAFT_660130 [Fomitopsis serialis]|uniref:uncharacterized protein n=1 Tax=Fomitopsis serialis TaxID=139415 RepID=UPI00200807A9|nr:uncharacterized protein B0H18DRAFT_660130 [Neoantrodia serialis]KAH9918825.1 hypothetical protein B0H18DRAFT_660130 [Neoantrodia serialis]
MLAASYPGLSHTARLTPILVWVLIFGLKFAVSYSFLALSSKTLVQVIAGMKIQNCNDLVLFFSDTFLWWIIRNTILSIVRLLALGLSIWTPLEGHLHAAAQANLRQAACCGGLGHEVQAQGASLAERQGPEGRVLHSQQRGRASLRSSRTRWRPRSRSLSLLMQCGRSQSWRCGREIRPTHPFPSYVTTSYGMLDYTGAPATNRKAATRTR